MINREALKKKLKTVVCEHFGIEECELFSKRRHKPIAQARQVYIHLLNKELQYKSYQIAIETGMRQDNIDYHIEVSGQRINRNFDLLTKVKSIKQSLAA